MSRRIALGALAAAAMFAAAGHSQATISLSPALELRTAATDPLYYVSFFTAMRRCEASLLIWDSSDSLPCAFEHLGDRAASQVWIWAAESGDTVQRVSTDSYRMLSGNCFTRTCTWIMCRPRAWPTFTCDDGRNRKMSAPDLSTMIFDGIKYRRVVGG